MPRGDGQNFTVAKVANFSETSKSRPLTDPKPRGHRFKTSFFDKHHDPKGRDVNFIYDFLRWRTH